MHFEIDQAIRAPRDVVEGALVEPAFIEAMGALPRIGAPTLLDQHRDGGRVRQRVRHRFTGELSGAARRVVDPARLSWVEESVFDPIAHRTDTRIVPDHYGTILTAWVSSTYLARGLGETVEEVRGEVAVSIPFVGSKVERALISGIREHASLRADLVARWLGDG